MMNAEMVFTAFAKYAESDERYYVFGRHGVIEDVLAFMGLPSKKFIGASSCVHADNLETLHKFLVTSASNEQLNYVYRITEGNTKIPGIKVQTKASGKVFVSMPMNRDKCQHVDEIREGIRVALKRTGNIPYFLDKDSHNDNIAVKMLSEVTSCKFLVADLTSQNNGVYYEAGYAKALGKTVILTCHESEFNSRHFDVQQVQTIKWCNSDDLSDKLYEQIVSSNLV